jgi:hypothetical protein
VYTLEHRACLLELTVLGTLCQVTGDTYEIHVRCIDFLHQSADDVRPADSTEVNIRYVG